MSISHLARSRLVCEADQFGPGHQICCGQDDFQPCGVGVGPVAGQVAQPGGLGLADAVLDPGVLAVAQFQAAELAGDHTGRGVGDERGDPQPVGVGEPQLGSGVGAFLAQDQPGPGGPAAHLDQPGGFGDPGAVTDAAAGIDRRIPAVIGVEDFHRVADSGVDGVAEGEPTPASRHAAANVWVAPAESERTRICCAPGSSGFGRYAAGSDSSACSSTVTWSAAVFEPAFPGRSSPASASPPAISGRSKNTSSG